MKKLFFLVLTLFIPTSHIIPVYTPHPTQVFRYENLILQMIESPQKPWDVKIYSDDGKPLPVSVSLDSENIKEVAENFNEILKDNAPEFKQSWQTIVGTFLNMENAIRFGSPIALFGIVALSGFYGARVAWKIIEKNLL